MLSEERATGLGGAHTDYRSSPPSHPSVRDPHNIIHNHAKFPRLTGRANRPLRETPPRRPSPSPIATPRSTLSHAFAHSDNPAARGAAGSSRPAARPSTHASRHHLEPNPFEQSFSSKPSSSGRSASPDGSRPADWGGARKSAHKSTKSDSGVDPSEDVSRTEDSSSQGGDSSKKSSGGPTTPGSSLSKRILPPVASIASPSGNNESANASYPWNSSLTSSLRSGPLSPAMLAGPQNFDPTAFRTGLTPDLSNFKTGLTPLGTAGASFPPPSPNTAAFLAMVTNGSANGLSGTAITPNTLSALSGNPIDVQSQTQSLDPNNKSGMQTQAPQASHHQQHAQSQQHQQQQQQLQQQYAQNEQRNGEASRNARNGKAPNQAASGLFLLSQAHHELAKRGDDANGVGTQSMFGAGQMPEAKSLYSNVPTKNDMGKAKGMLSHSMQEQVDSAKNGKRKNGAEPKAGAKKGKSGKGDVKQSPSVESDELTEEPMQHRADSAFDDGMSDNFGDDDEKRRNFLERNRQAALKCRQRKKAWLASLQAKVEYLQSDNEHLQGTVGALRNEVMFLKSQLLQAQRQLAPNGGGMGADQMPRHNVSGPMGMPNGMMPTAMTHVPHSSIHAMAAAAAAATSGANSLMGVAYASPPQHQAHIPRPTNMPIMQAGPQFTAQTGNKHNARQGPIQAV